MKPRPLCADCGIDTMATDEVYMVSNDVWDQAWAGCPRDESGLWKYTDQRDSNDEQPWLFEQLDRFVCEEEILCVGCLEKRIGRTLCRADFTESPINDPNRYPNKIHSDRLLERLTAEPSNNPTKPLDDFFRALMRHHGFCMKQKAAETDLGKPGPKGAQ